jgi:hypothetical protein
VTANNKRPDPEVAGGAVSFALVSRAAMKIDHSSAIVYESCGRKSLEKEE